MYTPWPGNFLSSCSFEFLLIAGSEILQYKDSLSKTRKVSTDDNQIFPWTLTNSCSQKN